MNVAALEPRLHEPPAGWSKQTLDAVTSALAGALVAAYRRDVEREEGP